MDNALLSRRVGPAVALLGGVMGLWHVVTPHYDAAALADAEAALLHDTHPRPTHRFVQAGWHPLHTLIVGDGPPLVMLHGHGGGVGVWHRNLSELSNYFRLYAIDWLGWGRSARPPFHGDAASARRWWVDSLEAWRQAIGLERFVLLGHSLGGWLAAEYALAHPHRVDHLVLMNTAGLVGEVDRRKSLLYVISPQRIVRAAGPLGPHLVTSNRALELQQNEAVQEALTAYYYHLSMAPLSGQSAFQAILSPTEWQLPIVPRADGLSMPLTIFWGMEDRLLSILQAHYLELRVPHAKLVLFPHAAHSPHAEDVTQFHDAMRAIRFSDA
ncbi:MAG: alpha/beta fold hydrolase [Anaerolineales bacterium]|nr:alpha/beta fold hydrolase [Anaerolineales bacterium]MCB9127040.1 alpha/beta fold hydrolase [Ardenticatenales bacterium]MCB9172436.1 alpha/beta fold hydrolase [Ardenticatenales bacterium]